ncbi:hypothetical protein [uncultured Caulobacter sp.]|uniref:hypothetical protein n=1 Tax=uncultured Caulobacter sp. TaxID=158749 RepID=UPI00262160D4|nr:hypothetical protein [uncultured Caulobacter sp.]
MSTMFDPSDGLLSLGFLLTAIVYGVYAVYLWRSGLLRTNPGASSRWWWRRRPDGHRPELRGLCTTSSF